MRKLLVAAAAVAMLATAVGSAEAAKLKACWVYTGPHNDGGFSQQHDIGRLDVEKALGDKVETSYVENVGEGPDAERVIDRLARSGCGVIFTTSFGFMDPTLKVAGEFPKIKFEHMAGFKTADNMSTYNLRWYQGRYVQGQIAAKMSKSGVAGYIVSFPIPEVVMGIDAFMLGAQSVNPNFKIKIIWVNSWFDPGKEADAAKTLIDQGADILVQHTDSPAAMQIAEKAGIHAFGQSADMSKFGPKAHLASLIDNWGPYYIKEVKAVLDGSWTKHETWAGMADDDVLVAPLTNMPDDVKAMAEKSIADIKSGKLVVFSGPVTKQDGTVAVPEGQVMADGDLLGLNWYVKGIDDKLPAN
jgi:simple sugar transport system substrate-binding protein